MCCDEETNYKRRVIKDGDSMMLDNSSYNKTKLLYALSNISWFIDKHALHDARISGDRELEDMLVALDRDAKKYIEKLRQAVCVISQ
jgi:hypothetical protein